MIQNTHCFRIHSLFAGILLGVALLCSYDVAQASSGGIDTSAANSGYAWSNVGGWVNFGTADGNVTVTDSVVTGYVWDANYGWLNLAPSTGGVTNDGEGNLGGYAWSAGGGWLSFEGITIDADGVFHGVTATSANYGRLSFDCAHCNVVTTWRKVSSRTTASGVSGNIPPVQQPVPAPLAPIATISVPLVAAAGGAVPDIRSATMSPQAAGKLLPERLFDIRLIVDRRQISQASELVARTTFESFGRVPTSVDLTFSILNASGANVYTKKDTVVIETEGVLVTRFDGVDLPVGKYVIQLHTVYNTDVTDDFEIPFEVIPPSGGAFPWSWILTALIAFATFFLLLLVWKRRRDEEKGRHGVSAGAHS